MYHTSSDSSYDSLSDSSNEYINNNKRYISNKGPKGDKGLTGDKGLAGDKGPTGDKGLTGDKGPSSSLIFADYYNYYTSNVIITNNNYIPFIENDILNSNIIKYGVNNDSFLIEPSGIYEITFYAIIKKQTGQTGGILVLEVNNSNINKSVVGVNLSGSNEDGCEISGITILQLNSSNIIKLKNISGSSITLGKINNNSNPSQLTSVTSKIIIKQLQ